MQKKIANQITSSERKRKKKYYCNNRSNRLKGKKFMCINIVTNNWPVVGNRNNKKEERKNSHRDVEIENE